MCADTVRQIPLRVHNKRVCTTNACCRGDLEMRLSREVWRCGGASVLLTRLKLAVVHLRVRTPGSTFSGTDLQ